MKETIGFVKMVDRVARAVDKIPQMAGTEAVNFSKQRFREGNWVDHSTRPWKPRKFKGGTKRRQGRAILVDRGRLRRSIRKTLVTRDRVVIGTDVPYARAHNKGFRGTVTQNVRAHSRRNRGGRKRGADGKFLKNQSTPTHRVRAHRRRMKINLPRRQFIGNSAVLNQRVERLMTAQTIRAIKNG